MSMEPMPPAETTPTPTAVEAAVVADGAVAATAVADGAVAATAKTETATTMAASWPALLAQGALAGAIGGAAAGAIDALWSWQGAAQFAPGALGRLRAVGFCASAYALVGAAAAMALVAGALVMLRGSRLGELASFGLRAHQERRARDPGEAVAGLALALVGIPALVVAGAVAHELSLPLLARRNPQLVVALILLNALAALGAAGVIALLLGRQLEVPLAALARRPALRALSAPPAAAVAAALLVGAALLALLIQQWETARQLPLRPAAAALGVLALAAAACPVAGQLRRRLGGWAGGGRAVAQMAQMAQTSRTARKSRMASTARTALLVAGLVALGLAMMLGFGASAATIKAATAYSGLGGPIAAAVRRGFDRDRDGYSWALGGGDCDDGDARVHPGAAEVPGDGVDQNCVAGDAVAERTTRDLAFAPLPPQLPGDANILLVTIDTLRADHLGAYGYPRATSPEIDRVAREGALFVHGWAHAPSTRYSMPAILTGRLPLQVFYDLSVAGWPGLAPKATTIAEVLKPLGFVTGAITNYWYFDRARRMDQGFDEYDNDNARLHSSVPGAGPAETSGSSAVEQTDKALAFVERHAGARWFLWVHYYDPHYAYEAHAGSPSFGASRGDLYDGEIRFTDGQLGRLFEGLRQRGLYDRTIIAITGDHGEGFGEHGIDLHGYHLYAAQTKVPLIVRAPGLPPRQSATPAGHIDLLPTLANLGGAAPGDATLADAMGRSLVDVMSGAPDRDREIWQQLSYEGDHELRAAASRACHVIYNVSPSSSWEVYQLDRDPEERQDVSAGEACRGTRSALERWYDTSQVPAGAAEALLPGRPTPAELPESAMVNVDYGGAVRLVAAQLPARARPGDTVEVTWTFEALEAAPAPPGWKVFVHVEGPMRFSGDHAPVRPFEWWQRGQFLRYTTQLVVPREAPVGKYTVWAGLWKGAKRMPAKGGAARVEQNRAAVGVIEVAP